MRACFLFVIFLWCFNGICQEVRINALIRKADKVSATDLTVATTIIDSALHLCETSKNDTLRANVLLKKGRIENYRGSYKSSLKYALRARKLFHAHNHTEGLAASFLLMGHDYSALKNYKKSHADYVQALHLARKINAKKTIAEAYNGLGNDAYDKADFETALKYYRQSKTYFIQLKAYLNVADLDNNIANIYSDQQLYPKAKKAYREALRTYIEQKDEISELYIYYNLAEVLRKEKQYDSSLYYLDLCLDLSLKSGSFANIQTTYSGLKETHQKMGDYKKALHFSELSHAYEDSIITSENDEYIARLEVEYQKKIDQRTIANQSRKLDAQTRQTYAAFIAMGVLVVLLILFFLYNRRIRTLNRRLAITNHKIRLKNTQIDKALQEREVLLKEVHHRVKNSLQIISSLLNLQELQLTDPNAIKALQESKSRIQSIALMHQNLYQQDADLGKVNIQSYLRDILELQQKAFSSPEKRVNCIFKVIPSELDIDRSVPLGLIASEVINNAFKHAFTSIEQPQLIVRTTNDHRQFVLEVIDNGLGLDSTSTEKGNSLGLEIVEALTFQLEGHFVLESRDEGTVFRLEFPV
ncbi:MAG: tetratricopeptide repeat protein [Bacteroidota bacterium]